MAAPWVAILRNRGAGTGVGRAQIAILCDNLRRQGLRPRVFSRRERLAERLAQPPLREALVCLVAAGGDGTVGDLINRFPDVPLTILPLGTENLLAKHLGIVCDGRRVAETIAERSTRRLDLGVLNGRRFTLMVSAGFDAQVVHQAHARRRSGGKWNYVQPLWETWRTYRYPEVRVTAQAPELRAAPAISGRLVVVANLPRYALGLPVAAAADGEDGLLDLRVFQRPSAFQMLRYFYKVARRQHEALPDVQSSRVQRVRIDSELPVPVQCDGDPAGWTPAEISVLPGALTLLVPKSVPIAARPAGSSAREQPAGN